MDRMGMMLKLGLSDRARSILFVVQEAFRYFEKRLEIQIVFESLMGPHSLRVEFDCCSVKFCKKNRFCRRPRTGRKG